MSNTEYWIKHWNTKTTVKEVWYPGIEAVHELTEDQKDELREEAYERGWNDALDDLEGDIWRSRK